MSLFFEQGDKCARKSFGNEHSLVFVLSSLFVLEQNREYQLAISLERIFFENEHIEKVRFIAAKILGFRRGKFGILLVDYLVYYIQIVAVRFLEIFLDGFPVRGNGRDEIVF